jgi:hypothetical protein
VYVEPPGLPCWVCQLRLIRWGSRHITYNMPYSTRQDYLQSLATSACSTEVVERGLWLLVAGHCLSRAMVRGRCVVFRRFYRSVPKSAGKDFRDGAALQFD